MTETSLLAEAVKQAPALAVLVIVVWLFLSKLGFFIEALKELHKEHIDARTQSREVMREHAKAMNDNSQTMARLLERLSCIVKQEERRQ